MRGWTTAAVLALLLFGCSDEGDAQAEVEERTGVDYEQVADDISTCSGAIQSGDPLTQDQHDGCSSALGGVTYDCDADGNSDVIAATVDDTTWGLAVGQPAVELANEGELRSLCP